MTTEADGFHHAVYKLAIAVLTAAILGLTVWIMNQGERVAALETTDKGLAKQIELVGQDVKEVKQDVRDVLKFLLDGVKPGQR